MASFCNVFPIFAQIFFYLLLKMDKGEQRPLVHFSPVYYKLVIINNTTKNKILNNVYITRYFQKFLG